MKIKSVTYNAITSETTEAWVDEVFTTDIVEPQLSYEEHVELLVRQRYSVNQELAILRQRDTKPNEFDEYFNYVEDCKNIAKR